MHSVHVLIPFEAGRLHVKQMAFESQLLQDENVALSITPQMRNAMLQGMTPVPRPIATSSRTYHLACTTRNTGQSLAVCQVLTPLQIQRRETGCHPSSPPPMCRGGPLSRQAVDVSRQTIWDSQ